MKSFRLFRAYFKTGLSLLAAYRLDFWFGRMRTLVTFFSIAWLWLAVFSGRTTPGYDAATMCTYVLAGGMSYGIIFSSSTEKDVAEDIYSGTLSSFLTRPLQYLWMRWSLLWPIRFMVILTVPLQLVLIRLVIPAAPLQLPATALPWLLFVVSIFLSCTLFFLLETLAGYTAFWLQRAYGARWMLHLFMVIGCGAYIPTTLLPKPAATLAFLTPYPWLIYGPASMLSTPVSAGWFLLPQMIWIIAIFFLVLFVWQRGLRRYEAVGI